MTTIKVFLRYLITVTIIGLVLVPGLNYGGSAYAQEAETGGFVFSIPPQPDWPVSSWDTGTSLTYKVTVIDGPETLECRIRMAVLGSEVIAGETLYWLEIDITEITGLSADQQSIFLQNYGEIPTAMRMKMEIPQENLMDLILDPTGFYHDFSAPGYVEEMIFQYNRQVPWDVDPALIGGWILPIGVTYILEGNLPDDFYDNRNIGIEIIQDDELYTTEISETSVTTEAGGFECSQFVYTGTNDTAGNGTIFYSDELPILPVLMITANFMGPMSGSVELELIEMEESGAGSQIVGDPAPLNLQTMMQMGM